MARPLRIEYAGAIYHVTGRMVGSWRHGQAPLFRDEQDYRRLVRKRTGALPVGQVLERAGVALGLKPEEIARKYRATQSRAIMARCLTRRAGKTQREAAELLGVKTGAVVNIQIRKLNESSAKDKRLQQLLNQLDQGFERQRTA